MKIASANRPRETDLGIAYRLLLLTAVLLVAGGIATFITTFRHSNDQSAASQSAARPVANISTTDSYIASLQAKLNANENDADSLAQLGAAYLQKTRETGDPAYYPKAEDVLDQALALDAQNPGTLDGLASLALARHDFQGGLLLGARAIEIDPSNARSYGVAGDALTELGRYSEAIATFQTMIDLKPDLSSYARMPYARELHGDIAGARQAMQLAVDSAGSKGEGVAWTHLQLGNLYFNYGDVDNAEVQYNASLDAFPGYVHGLAGLAKVKAARGDSSGAITLYRQVVDRYPVLEYVVALGDLYQKSGNQAEANKQYELVESSISSCAPMASTAIWRWRSTTPTTTPTSPTRCARPARSTRAGRAFWLPTFSDGRCTSPASTRRRSSTQTRRDASAAKMLSWHSTPA